MQSPFLGESQVALLAVKLAIEHQVRYVIFEGDQIFSRCYPITSIFSQVLRTQLLISLDSLFCWDFLFVNMNVNF
jgi:hypothetical protein